MYRVMIVDDEKWVRRGLIQSIPWERLGLELAGEAADGQDAYELLLADRPDLLFLDMRMPGLDGKELLGLLDARMPELLTIVVSGYSDFEYTQQAIRHHAFDYLLKPVKKEELAAVLEKAVAALAQRDEDRRHAETAERSGRWFRDLLLEQTTAVAAGEAAKLERSRPGAGTHVEGREVPASSVRPDGVAHAEGRRGAASSARDPQAPAGAELLPAWWLGKRAVVFAARADGCREEAGDPALLGVLREKLARERAFYYGGEWDAVLLPAADGRPDIIGAVAAAAADLSGLERLLAGLQSELRRQYGGSWSIGVSEWTDAEPLRLRRALLQAQSALAERRLTQSEAILKPPPPGVAAAPGWHSYPEQREQELLLALQMGSEAESLRAADRLLAEVCSGPITVGQLEQGAIALVHALERQLRAHGGSLEHACGRSPQALTESLRCRGDAASVRVLFTELIIPGILLAQQRQGGTAGERIVREVEALIEQHYDQQLSLQQIAESRYVHPDYLSRLFKKTTGRGFVDYLAEIRLRKAMALMEVPGYKNYEIARKVGYEDYRYFSQIFKKRTGQTIGAYRSGLDRVRTPGASGHHSMPKER